jgi:hypothetical protein
MGDVEEKWRDFKNNVKELRSWHVGDFRLGQLGTVAALLLHSSTCSTAAIEILWCGGSFFTLHGWERVLIPEMATAAETSETALKSLISKAPWPCVSSDSQAL